MIQHEPEGKCFTGPETRILMLLLLSHSASILCSVLCKQQGSSRETEYSQKSYLCSCRFIVHGLTTGETYVFRVQAINELGLSDESQESAPLSVRAALSMYQSAAYTQTEEQLTTLKNEMHSTST